MHLSFSQWLLKVSTTPRIGVLLLMMYLLGAQSAVAAEFQCLQPFETLDPLYTPFSAPLTPTIEREVERPEQNWRGAKIVGAGVLVHTVAAFVMVGEAMLPEEIESSQALEGLKKSAPSEDKTLAQERGFFQFNQNSISNFLKALIQHRVDELGLPSAAMVAESSGLGAEENGEIEALLSLGEEAIYGMTCEGGVSCSPSRPSLWNMIEQVANESPPSGEPSAPALLCLFDWDGCNIGGGTPAGIFVHLHPPLKRQVSYLPSLDVPVLRPLMQDKQVRLKAPPYQNRLFSRRLAERLERPPRPERRSDA